MFTESTNPTSSQVTDFIRSEATIAGDAQHMEYLRQVMEWLHSPSGKPMVRERDALLIAERAWHDNDAHRCIALIMHAADMPQGSYGESLFWLCQGILTNDDCAKVLAHYESRPKRW